jgi:hypothetical protein
MQPQVADGHRCRATSKYNDFLRGKLFQEQYKHVIGWKIWEKNLKQVSDDACFSLYLNNV